MPPSVADEALEANARFSSRLESSDVDITYCSDYCEARDEMEVDCSGRESCYEVVQVALQIDR